jgi:hypothetical protein
LEFVKRYASVFDNRSSFDRKLSSSLTSEAILLRNSARCGAVIGLDIISIHAKLTLCFRPLMCRTSFSRSLGMALTATAEQTAIAIIKLAIHRVIDLAGVIARQANFHIRD